MTSAVWRALPLVVVMGACQNGSIAPTSLTTLDLTGFVSAVSVGATEAAARSGAAPVPAGGPTVTVSGNATVINGGTLAVSVAAAQPFQTVYVAVGGRTVGLASESAGGVSGYFEARLPAPQTDAGVLLAFPQTVPVADLDLLFAVADTSGRVGPFERLATRVTAVGTGDVQVTLSWNVDSDVDLHVVDPSGEEIYWAHRRAASGGELDLDSNAGCQIDGVRNENITWPAGRAPRGQYTVRVDYWDSCGASRTEYTVRVNSGGAVRIFNGSFTGPGDQGGPGSGQLITVFERTTGPVVTVGPAAQAAPAAAEPPRKVRGVGHR